MHMQVYTVYSYSNPMMPSPADHMVGLDSAELLAVLKRRRERCIYAHEITAHLLAMDARYAHLGPYITTMKCGQPITVDRPDDQATTSSSSCLTVACVTAGHCAGSVMCVLQYTYSNPRNAVGSCSTASRAMCSTRATFDGRPAICRSIWAIDGSMPFIWTRRSARRRCVECHFPVICQL